MKRRKQNQNISFQFFAAPPCTPRRFFKDKEIFGFACATGRSAPEARWNLHSHGRGAYAEVWSCHARGAWTIRQNPADFVHTMFELRSKNTANLQP